MVKEHTPCKGKVICSNDGKLRMKDKKKLGQPYSLTPYFIANVMYTYLCIVFICACRLCSVTKHKKLTEYAVHAAPPPGSMLARGTAVHDHDITGCLGGGVGAAPPHLHR